MSQTVTPELHSVNEESSRRFIKPAVFQHLLGDPSKMTIWRWRKSMPDFPQPHPQFGYLLDEVKAFIERKAAERHAK
jgi:hypothetical protein